MRRSTLRLARLEKMGPLTGGRYGRAPAAQLRRSVELERRRGLLVSRRMIDEVDHINV
jgi:hypothetical protein